MARDADLEIVLAWRTQDCCFDVSLAFDDPRSVGDGRHILRDPIAIDTVALELLEHDPTAYGAKLSEQLYAAGAVRDYLIQAAAVAKSTDTTLRLRIAVDPDAPPDVQAIRWETLRHPQDGTAVALRRDIRLSRYLSGKGWDLIAPPRKHDLHALVVVASPSDLDEYDFDPPLAPVDVDAELDRAKAALKGIRQTVLAKDRRPTLNAIKTELDHGIDVLYLVCHGAMVDGRSILLLEKDDGSGASVSGTDLAEAVEGLEHRPTLAVLCSCQSAGGGSAGETATTDGGAFAPVGPRLAQAGVAAVVAMQADVTMTSAARFLESFFAELQRDGIVDRASNAARDAIRDRPDWWVPVLFSRLKRGRTYYTAGLADEGEVKWQAIVAAIDSSECTPVLGPGLAEPVLLPRQALARRWVERWLLPIAEPSSGDMTTVAQYVRAGTARYTAHQEVANYLVAALRDDARYGDLDRTLFERKRTGELLRILGERAREEDPADPHAVVAGLDLPVYITTSWTDLLSQALEARGRLPTVLNFDWNDVDFDREPLSELEEPTPDEPLVFHLFGRLEQPRSLVLTEDDHFQWLVAWVARRRELVPSAVLRALTEQSLMFVGYRLADWDFRVLFQSLKTLGGHSLLRDHQHVGVQLDPSAPGVEPEAGQEYLESYFGEDKVAIYWGATQEFLAELVKRTELGV